MNRNPLVVSRRMVKVWEWKDVLHREVENLPAREGLRKIIEKGRVCARQSGLPRPPVVQGGQDAHGGTISWVLRGRKV